MLLLLLADPALAADVLFAYVRAPGAPDPTVTWTADVAARSSGALRFADPGVGRTGLVQRLGAEASPAPWLRVGATGLLSVLHEDDSPATASAAGFARATAPLGGGGWIGGEVGMHREFGGVVAATGTVLGGVEKGRLAVGANLVLEKRFVEGADRVDVVLPAGASVGVGEHVRAGVEYIGQDLEDLVEEEEAEGGASHLFAAAVGVSTGTLRATVAPGVAVGPGGAGLAGRVGLSVGF